MDFITDQIAIGDAEDAADMVEMRNKGIRSVISLNGQLLGVSPDQLAWKPCELSVLAMAGW